MTRPFGRWMVLLLLAAAIVYLIGNDRVGLWDRDEPRYAQTSKQMLQSNPPNWVVPHFLDQVRTAKPAMIYWCQASAMRFLGVNEFAARLPSAIAMLLTLLVLCIAITRGIGPRRAFWTAFVFATSVLVMAAAKMCITDSVLLLWITIAQFCLFAIYRGDRSWRTVIVLWLAIGLAGLTKGPVVLGVQLATMLALAGLDVGARWRSGQAWKEAFAWWRHTRPLLGLAMVALIVGPWLVAIQLREPMFLRRTLWHDVFSRTIKPLEGHKGPPGFYLFTIWGTFLPWCMLLPTTFVLAWRNRRLTPVRFALAAVIGPWFVWELIQTKLVHYMLPIFPPLAFLTADALVRCIRGQYDDLVRPLAKLAAGILAAALLGLGLAPWALAWKFGASGILVCAMIVLSLVGLLYAAAVYTLFARKRIATGGLAMGVGMLAVVLVLYGLYLPNARFLWLPSQVGRWLVNAGATTKGDAVMVDFKEDSLPYYQGGTIREWPTKFITKESPDKYIASQPPENWPTWMVMTRALWKQLPARVTDHLSIQVSFHGLAYADKGKTVEVLIVRKK